MPVAEYAQAMRMDWFIKMLGWKEATKKASPRCRKMFDAALGPNLADLSSSSSAEIAGRVYKQLGIGMDVRASIDLDDDDFESNGTQLEEEIRKFIAIELQKTRQDIKWKVERNVAVDIFQQYRHLARLNKLLNDPKNIELRQEFGRDYQIKTDVIVSVPDQRITKIPILHAAVSSKLTIRSDRVQNVRHEFSTLIKTRNGRLPHLVVVTAEPMPSRIKSIAQGTGEVDCVYHLLFDEIEASLKDPTPWVTKNISNQIKDWNELVNRGRIKPIKDLIPTIAFN